MTKSLLQGITFFSCLCCKSNSDDNYFHNFYHGVSVLHVSYLSLIIERVQEWITPLDMLACLTAALCHDIDHPVGFF